MCSTCTTAVDAIGTNAVFAAALAANGWDRLADRVQRRPRRQRQRDIWHQNAEFMRALGLDPLAVLGEPPAERPSVSSPAS